LRLGEIAVGAAVVEIELNSGHGESPIVCYFRCANEHDVYHAEVKQ
jgi:hypothetical protein